MLPKPEKCHTMHIGLLKDQPDFPKFTLNGEETTLPMTRSSLVSKYTEKNCHGYSGHPSVNMYVVCAKSDSEPRLLILQLTKNQIDDIELIQKTASRISLDSQYKSCPTIYWSKLLAIVYQQ